MKLPKKLEPLKLQQSLDGIRYIDVTVPLTQDQEKINEVIDYIDYLGSIQ
jgi:hypothetical protein